MGRESHSGLVFLWNNKNKNNNILTIKIVTIIDLLLNGQGVPLGAHTFIYDGNKNNNENNKTTHHSKRLENAYNEVASIEKLYTEFQEEILDSHKSIIDSLRMPIMKG